VEEIVVEEVDGGVRDAVVSDALDGGLGSVLRGTEEGRKRM
jgi:hypothetical protein